MIQSFEFSHISNEIFGISVCLINYVVISVKDKWWKQTIYSTVYDHKEPWCKYNIGKDNCDYNLFGACSDGMIFRCERREWKRAI